MDKNEPQARHSSQIAAKTGIDGLDEVLNGGLTANRLYLIEGDPGAGKTTLAVQFLLEGIQQGETALYISMSETEAELRAIADSHGFSLGNLNIFAATPTEDSLQPDQQYTMFHPSEVELSATSSAILNEVERLKPSRVVFDSMSELRTLAATGPQYRRQVLALKQFFSGRHCTVLILDDATNSTQLRSIAHGVIVLEQFSPPYGAERRRLQVVKYRGMQLKGGYHDYAIRRGGLQVFPRLVPFSHRAVTTHARLESGVAELDHLLGGGIERGTSTLIVGAAGCGKSTLAMQFAIGAANQGLRAALFMFDESVGTLLTRADGLNIPMRRHYEAGIITLQPVDPAELSPGEFAYNVVKSAERDGAVVVVIDSLNGYLNSMPDDHFLSVQLHELLNRLGQLDVATMLVGVQHGLIGSNMTSPVDASYLADAVLLLRYFEANGEIRQALSVMKKRGGAHERTIREFRLDSSGVRVGEPLREFRGVLTGVPVYEGKPDTLLKKRREKMTATPQEMQLLLLAPTGKDADMARSLLGAAGIECTLCRDISGLCASIKEGADAVMIAEEALVEPARTVLAAIVAAQPPWSDLPVLLLRHKEWAGSSSMPPGADLGNVTLIDRPIRVAALVSAVRVALRARERQYQIRSHIEQLKRAEQSLRILDSKKDEFLATLAHELRNPLAAIGNAAQLISQPQASARQVGYGAEIVQRQLGQLARLVDDLLDTSRVTRGKVTLQKQYVDLGTIVEGAVETIRPAIGDANQELRVELPAGPIRLEGDPIRLSQILTNLLTNASKYTPPRGSVALRIDCDAQHVFMTVEDTGIGIPADALPSIFDMFVQIKKNGLDRGTGGLGVGLTLVKSFVELHGGTIEAHSDGPDRGTRFVVCLPRGAIPDNEDVTRDEWGSSKRSQLSSGRRILIADDNRDQAESLSLLLEMMGNKVHTVYDGLSAIQAVQAFRPQIVLMDIGMPVMDGLEAARRIRTSFPQEPLLVAVTGWGQDDDRRRAQEAGFDHHLIKPIDWAAIDKLLAQVDKKNRLPAAPEGLTG